ALHRDLGSHVVTGLDQVHDLVVYAREGSEKRAHPRHDHVGAAGNRPGRRELGIRRQQRPHGLEVSGVDSLEVLLDQFSPLSHCSRPSAVQSRSSVRRWLSLLMSNGATTAWRCSASIARPPTPCQPRSWARSPTPPAVWWPTLPAPSSSPAATRSSPRAPTSPSSADPRRRPASAAISERRS